MTNPEWVDKLLELKKEADQNKQKGIEKDINHED